MLSLQHPPRALLSARVGVGLALPTSPPDFRVWASPECLLLVCGEKLCAAGLLHARQSIRLHIVVRLSFSLLGPPVVFCRQGKRVASFTRNVMLECCDFWVPQACWLHFPSILMCLLARTFSKSCFFRAELNHTQKHPAETPIPPPTRPRKCWPLQLSAGSADR